MKIYLVIPILLLTAICLFAACATENVTPLLPQETPLLPPRDLATTRTENGDVLLTWEPNTQLHLLGYNIYRSEFREDSFTKINPEPVLLAEYRDRTAAANTRYEYHVTCVGIDNRESGFSFVIIYNGITADGNREKKPGM